MSDEKINSSASDLKELKQDLLKRIDKLKSGEIEALVLQGAPKRAGFRLPPKNK